MKPITEMTEEELLELIKDEPNKVKIYEWPNDVMEFISVYNLKSGQEFITKKLLYKLYKSWSPSPIKMRQFTNVLTDIFPSNGSCIFLNKTMLNIREEAYNHLKKQDKSRNKKWLEHFNKFKHEFCIEKGGLFIKDTVLYNIYDKWCFKKRSPVSLVQFANFCKLYYDFKIIRYNYWFKVDESIKKHLTEDLIKEMSKKRAGPKKTIS